MMMARGRGYNQDWDPMREDFDNSNYEPQNPDDSSSSYVNLDHCRLYVTHIPRALNEEGLSTAFSKYGRLVECYMNSDPERRYGLVTFETPGEAKLAMMKLNRAEPLNLQVNIAHKSKTKRPNDDNSGYRAGNSSGTRTRDTRGFREDSGCISCRSNTRRQDFMANGDNMEELNIDDDVVLNNSLEPDVNLELEQLKLEHLKLQEAQVLCKHRMLLLKQAEKKSNASTRCVLPDGRIVVRNVEKGEIHDADGSFGAGAGDMIKIPGLQTFGACVACGERAVAFCCGCRVTPYCSAACQRRDWGERHKEVCHNLRRQPGGPVIRPEPEPVPIIPAPAPLRQPRTPDSTRDGSGSDKMPPRKFGPPGNATSPSAGRSGGARGGYRRNVPDHRGRSNRSSDDDGDRPNARHMNGRNDMNKNQNNRNDNRPRQQDGPQNRQFARQVPGGRSDNKQNEDWDARPAQTPPEPKPAMKPQSPIVPKEEPKMVAKPKPVQAEPAAGPSVSRPMATVADVSLIPARKLVPKNYVLELLSVKDTFMLSVEATGEDRRDPPGFVCVIVIVDGEHADNYLQLLDPLAEACEVAEPYEPRPGETFAYLDPSDGGWYRARCLTPALGALLDANRLAALTPADRCRRLPAGFLMPEYCCHLESDRVKLNDVLQCTVVSKSGSTLTVSVVNQETGTSLGNATVRRWLPEVERSKEAAAATASPAASAPGPSKAPAAAPGSSVNAPSGAASSEAPQVPRPPVAGGSGVFLVDATEPGRVFVRPSSRDKQSKFDELVYSVATYGADESTPRLKELPTRGQTVVARFTDDHHYRAQVKRVDSKRVRCLLEYIEYGNVAIIEDLDSLSTCPAEFDLAACPTLTSMVTLQMAPKTFSDDAMAYIEKLKDENIELTLTIPSGEKSAPCGAPVRLTVAKSGEDVNRTIEALSTPEWQKLLDRGGDVLEVKSLNFPDLVYVDPCPGELAITDCSMLDAGVVYGHQRGAPHAQRAFALTPKIEEYCNSALAKDPYLPNLEELCIAKCPNKKQWLRAVLVTQPDGPGGEDVVVQFVDYGHMSTDVTVSSLRKMMPEFVHGVPVAAVSLEIKDFPKNPTPEQLETAIRHMGITESGNGVLWVTRCQRQDIGEYLVEAPDLIKAVTRQ